MNGNPSSYRREWLRYQEANVRAHRQYMRYYALRPILSPIEVVRHGPHSDAHSCKRDECAQADREYRRNWQRKRREELREN